MERSVPLSEGHQHIQSKVLVICIREARILFYDLYFNEKRLLSLVCTGIFVFSDGWRGRAPRFNPCSVTLQVLLNRDARSFTLIGSVPRRKNMPRRRMPRRHLSRNSTPNIH